MPRNIFRLITIRIEMNKQMNKFLASVVARSTNHEKNKIAKGDIYLDYLDKH